MTGKVFINGKLYKEPQVCVEARTPRFLTFFGGPKDGCTEFVKEIYVGFCPALREGDLIESWTWVDEPFLPYQEWKPNPTHHCGLAGYTVVADMAFFSGCC